MKERPLLFSGSMIRANLADNKTQTRRVMKPQPDDKTWFENEADGSVTWHRDGEPCCGTGVWEVPHSSGKVPCPYGAPVDRLWVREAWRAPARYDEMPPRDVLTTANIRYEADGYQRIGTFDAINLAEPWGKLRPSMFMPRHVSRITLELVSVRVERLQDISEADALAEGIVRVHEGFGLPDGSHYHAADPRISYWSLWDAINGVGATELNPTLWAIEFRRLP